MATSPTLLTPDEFLVMPDGGRFELIDGELVERSMGAESSRIAVRIAIVIGTFCEEHKSGIVFDSECGYQCFRESSRKVRRPDISFVARGRLPNDVAPKGWISIPPDLAIEITSPGDTAAEIGLKVEDFLAAGTSLVWVVNPEPRTVLVYRADGSIVGLRENDQLTGETVLPGFHCRVGDLFPPRTN